MDYENNQETVTLTYEKLTELLYQVAGATSASFMMRMPNFDFAEVTEEVKASIINIIDSFDFDV